MANAHSNLPIVPIDVAKLIGAEVAQWRGYVLALGVAQAAALAHKMRALADNGQSITPEALGRIVGMTPQMVMDIEQSQLTDGPTFAMLKLIADACGLEMVVELRRKQHAEEKAEHLNLA